MPANMPKFQVNVMYAGEIYGIDIADIQGRQHLVCMDYKFCCIFERELNGLHTTEVVRALKSIFCDVGAPDKIISDNARYFISEEFQEFTMQWSIQHIMSSPRFPHGNAHAEKAVHIVKQIYQKANDVKLALLLLKCTPISNKSGRSHDARANVFFGRQCFDINNKSLIIQIHVLTMVPILRFHQSTVKDKVFGLSLTPTQSGCQTRLCKFCPTRVTLFFYQMDVSAGEINTTLHSNDQVPNH